MFQVAPPPFLQLQCHLMFVAPVKEDRECFNLPSTCWLRLCNFQKFQEIVGRGVSPYIF